MAKIINSGSDKHVLQMKVLAEFADADSIEYVDHGDSENYILCKGSQKITVKACYNRMDGGFLAIRIGEDRNK